MILICTYERTKGINQSRFTTRRTQRHTCILTYKEHEFPLREDPNSVAEPSTRPLTSRDHSMGLNDWSGGGFDNNNCEFKLGWTRLTEAEPKKSHTT